MRFPPPIAPRITTVTPLLLGSASPRRRSLLESLGLPLIVRAASVDETVRASETPERYLDRITATKLGAIRAAGLGEAVAVLVADTIVVAPDGTILGKPADAAQASGASAGAETQRMIERLAGVTHEVSTRFVLSSAEAGAPVAHAETVTTRVAFRTLASGEAAEYAATGEGNDKAGGYAVQGRAGAFVERIDGSYTSVVGLPLCEVVVAIRALGWW